MEDFRKEFEWSVEKNRSFLPTMPTGEEYETLLRKFETVIDRLVEWNEKIRLSGIHRDIDMLTLHIIDSLSLINEVPNNARVIDVGCGAGFPSLPIAIFRPDVKVTALDATAKKLRYTQAVKEELGLDNLTVLPGRAEELSKTPDYREKFDVCVCRAVTNMPVLCELCLPFVRVNGKWVTMKGPNYEGEYEDAQNGIRILGGSITSARKFEYRLVTHSEVFEAMDRFNMIFYKENRTPAKYPRIFSQISSKPLN